jgi:hypothetical protein
MNRIAINRDYEQERINCITGLKEATKPVDCGFNTAI